jgi:formylglycine-generating enzyme required for sulfatase activity
MISLTRILKITQTHTTLLFSLIALLSISTVLAEERRVALVIGNADYPDAVTNNLFRPLRNPVNDAEDMAKMLRSYNFVVLPVKNATQQQIDRAVNQFTQQLQSSNVGLFYYAGHGVQVQNKNYLIPVGKKFRDAREVEEDAVSATDILNKMEKANKAAGANVNIVILDACREHLPLVRSSSNSKGFYSRGLARMDARGTIIGYATAPGDVAVDGVGRNGVYTKHLLKAMKTGHLTIERVFKEARIGVAKETDYQQIPWESTSLIGDFCFGTCDGLQPQPLVFSSDDSLLDKNERRLGKAFRDRLKPGDFGPEMVLIPAGQFRMGDIQGKGDNDEQPVHWVSIDSFAIGRYEVTFAEYDRFAEATGRNKPDDEGWGRGNRPAINVSWLDAMAYTQWLSQQTGKQYCLPTEAQWEYAARAGTQTPYWWGSEIGYNQANCNGCSGRWDYRETAPVGSFAANAFGLYETMGNVWEWTCSEYKAQYNGTEKRCLRRNNNRRAVIRGGSWNDKPKILRTANRYSQAVSNRKKYIGFRVCRLR